MASRIKKFRHFKISFVNFRTMIYSSVILSVQYLFLYSSLLGISLFDIELHSTFCVKSRLYKQNEHERYLSSTIFLRILPENRGTDLYPKIFILKNRITSITSLRVDGHCRVSIKTMKVFYVQHLNKCSTYIFTYSSTYKNTQGFQR